MSAIGPKRTCPRDMSAFGGKADYACADQFWQRTCDELRLVFLTRLWTRTAHVVLLRMVRGRFPKLRYG
jgi:hypothetical protein